MIVVQINFTCEWGSTGKICDSVSKLLTQKNYDNYIFYIHGNEYREKRNYVKYSNYVYTKFQAIKARVLGNYGFNSSFSTKLLINRLEKINPDIIHIHNIHGHDCNFEMLFDFLRKKRIKAFYTFHDCWAFTGYCPHFVMAKCDRWLSGCGNCVLRNKYSWFFDKSAKNFIRKKNALKDLNLTIITPSQWLAGLVKESFLKDYSVEVINNGIDLSTFNPIQSDFREKNNLQNKLVVLGVAFCWGVSKGLDVFIELAKRLDPDKYQIVLVGTDNRVDKQLPPNIISIHRTHNQQELAEIYSAADVFVNPTREENYPTVNMESIACGTPVLTFRTGGSPEMLDETCGSVVDCDDIDALEKEIVRICEEKPYSIEQCINKAKEFDKNEKYKEYLELYERIVSSGT